MASTIVTKNSSTASAVPVSGDLTQGELAVNVTDKKLYTKDSGGTVVKLVGGLGNQEANAVAITGGSVNGTTIGATTASTGAFTTLSASSTTTLSGGTANGVAYLNGSKVVTTGTALTFDGTNLGIGTSSPASKLHVESTTGNQLRIAYNSSFYWKIERDPSTGALKFSDVSTERLNLDQSGNLGLGVTPSASWNLGKAFEIGTSTGNSLWGIGVNALSLLSNSYYNSGYKYSNNGTATRYDCGAGNGTHAWHIAASGTAGNAITFTQAMTLDASGNVGIGLTTQNERLRIGSSSAAQARMTIEYNGSVLTYFGSYSGIVGSGNATDTMLASSAVLAFATGGTSERARIDTSGNLLVGTTSSTTTPANGVQLNNPTTNSTVAIGHASGTASGNYYVNCGYAGTSIGSITQNGTTGVLYNVTSDQRLKENIQDADSASELIDSLQVRQFDWKTDGNHQRYGFVAQELVTVAPEAVHQPTDPDEMMAVDYSKLVPMLVKEIQSLRKRVAQLEGK